MNITSFVPKLVVERAGDFPGPFPFHRWEIAPTKTMVKVRATGAEVNETRPYWLYHIKTFEPLGSPQPDVKLPQRWQKNDRSHWEYRRL